MLLQASVFIAARLMSMTHKLQRTLSSWPGRIIVVTAFIVMVRLAWAYASVTMSRSSLIPPDMMRMALGMCCWAAWPLYCARACLHPSMVLTPGDLSICDIRLMIRPAAIAGLLARAVGLGALLFVILPILFWLSPTVFPTVSIKFQTFGVLWLFVLFVSICGTLSSMLSFGDGRRYQAVMGLWVGVAVVEALIFAHFLLRQNSVDMDIASLSHIYPTMIAAWPLLLLCTAVVSLLVVSLAPSALPGWTPGLLLLTNVLDMADSRDADSALALVRRPQTSSMRFPTTRFSGASAFLWRGHLEAKRRGVGKALLLRGAAAFTLTVCMSRFAHPVWWLSLLIVGGLESSICVQDGAMRETNYPFLSFGSGTLLTRCAWASALPCIRMLMIMAASSLGLYLSSAQAQFIALSLSCGVGWSLLSAASSCAGAIVRFRENDSWMRKGIIQFASIGGTIIMVLSVAANGFAGLWGLILLPLALFALTDWMVLYLATSSRHASDHINRNSDQRKT